MNKKKFNLLDIFLVLFVLLTSAAVYFTFFKPVLFSHMIEREGVSGYAEVDFVLAQELEWLGDQVPPGLELKNVYGTLEWKILAIERAVLGERAVRRVKARVLLTREASGLLRYGKYTLVRGGKIILLNDDYLLEGRIEAIRILDEKILL